MTDGTDGFTSSQQVDVDPGQQLLSDASTTDVSVSEGQQQSNSQRLFTMPAPVEEV